MKKIKDFLAKHIYQKTKEVFSNNKFSKNIYNTKIYKDLYKSPKKEDLEAFKKDAEALKSDWEKFLKF